MAMKPLVLTIDGKTDGLKQAADATKQTLATMETEGLQFADAFDKVFAKIASSSAEHMQAMSKNIASDIQRMKREAEAAASSGGSFNPVGGMSSAGAQSLADNYSRSAAQLHAQAEAMRRVAQEDAGLAVQATAAAQAFHAQARGMEVNAEAALRSADLLRAYEVQMGTAGTAAEMTGGKIARSSGAMRAGMQQLSFQVNDVTTQFAAGTSPMIIFAQQGGQVVQALQLMSVEAKGFLGFLGGPWGMLIISGATVLGTLVAQSDLFGDSLDENAKALDAVKAAEDGVSRAQSILGQMFDLTTGKIKDQNDLLRLNLELLSAQLQAEADAARGKAETGAENAGKPNWGSVLQNAAGGGAQGYKSATPADGNTVARAKLEDVLAGRASASEVAHWARSADFSKLDMTRADYLDAVKNAAEAAVKSKTAAAIDRTLGTGRLDPSLMKPATGGGMSAGDEASIGDMTALIRQLFPGATITATTNGKHVKGSDHYAGRAIDFVPAGGMGSISTSDVYDRLEAAGVKIRRNAAGKEQFFGPGRPASKPGDHNDHFHVAWQGSASPERAAQAAKREAEEAQRNLEAHDGALLASKTEAARIAREGVTDASRLAELDKAAIDAALAQKLAQNARLKLAHADVDAQDRANADAAKAAVDRRLARELAGQALTKEADGLRTKGELLDIEGQLATTTVERRRIALALLENERQQEVNAARAKFNQDGDADAFGASLAGIDRRNAGKRAVFDKQSQGPLADYRDRLKAATDDWGASLDGVAVNALQGLEDGLLGIVNGTESVAGAFKRMAASIIADLARIAIEKAILGAFGLAGFNTGKVPAHATGMVPGFASGVISGAGTGTSDSIMAWHEGMGLIRVSNGESIITAEGTRKHRGLLKAINDNALPSFAEGMVGAMAYPTLPSAGSLRSGGNGRQILFDLRGAVITEDLLRQMNAIAARHAAVALASAPAVTMSEMADHQWSQVPA